MIQSLEARRLTALTVLFVGLLVAFSALAFAARGRQGLTFAAVSIGMVTCAFAVRWLWRLPRAAPDEQRTRDATP